jgi:hypothetical protein
MKKIKLQASALVSPEYFTIGEQRQDYPSIKAAAEQRNAGLQAQRDDLNQKIATLEAMDSRNAQQEQDLATYRTRLNNVAADEPVYDDYQSYELASIAKLLADEIRRRNELNKKYVQNQQVPDTIEQQFNAATDAAVNSIEVKATEVTI